MSSLQGNFNPATDVPTKLFGYEVIEPIGRGAGSTIYAVTHPSTQQVYALKHVVRKDDKSIRFIEQLENEHAIGCQLRHANLRGVIGIHVHRTLMRRITDAGLVMELVDGLPLDVRLPRRTSDILRIFLKTAHALDAMHAADFVHCDLKPGNILASDSGAVRVIDLGQACKTGTAKKRIQGTPDYISPEQVKCQPVSAQTDVYNFGASLYWSLTGKKLPTLFTLKKGDNSFLVDTQIPTPAELNPTIAEPLSQFVMECVRSNPSKRPESMKSIMPRLDLFGHTARKSEKLRAASVA